MPPPLLSEYREIKEGWRALPLLPIWLRALLALMALAAVAVFVIAAWLNPYDNDGEARLMETHMQLGMPECTFKQWTGKPCPSCGMTTSFALLVRGDVPNSVRANGVGTLLAVFCLALIPYGLITAGMGRYWLMPSLEWLLPRVILLFFTLMMLRWGLVLWLG